MIVRQAFVLPEYRSLTPRMHWRKSMFVRRACVVPSAPSSSSSSKLYGGDFLELRKDFNSFSFCLYVQLSFWYLRFYRLILRRRHSQVIPSS